MLCTLLASLLLWQDPANKPVKPEPQPEAKAQPVEAWDDAKAKDAVADLTKALKGTPSMVQKTRALEQIATGSNKLLVKPLTQVIELDKSVVVRKQAAVLLGNQPASDANPAIRKLLKSPRVASFPPVMAELVRGLVRCDYAAKQWADVADLFEQKYDTDRVPLQEALLDLVIATKETQAIPMLLRNIDEPIPKDVHVKENPPAEYWKARWESWAVWRGKVKDALFTLTGQHFSTSSEAEAWLKKNPLK